jgi:aldose 1-epimerase
VKGFDKVMWTPVGSPETDKITLEYVAADMEEGYPGRIQVRVTYSVSTEKGLEIAYEAVSLDGKPSIVNLTNHSYFNLDGFQRGSTALHHRLQIHGPNAIMRLSENQIPTGDFDVLCRNSPYYFGRDGKHWPGNRKSLEDPRIRSLLFV